MRRSTAVLNDRMEPERTRELLKAEWQRLGGSERLLAAYVEVFRRARPTLRAVEALADSYEPQSKPVRRKRSAGGNEVLVHLNRLMGVASAVAQLDHFMAEDRPRIIEALRLADTQSELKAMLKAHFKTRPEDTELAVALQMRLEKLYERSLTFASSPPALRVLMSRRGQPAAYLIRLVIAPMYQSGYDWTEIAALVDDGQVTAGRAERLRKLHETNVLETMRKRFNRRNDETGSDLGK